MIEEQFIEETFTYYCGLFTLTTHACTRIVIYYIKYRVTAINNTVCSRLEASLFTLFYAQYNVKTEIYLWSLEHELKKRLWPACRLM